MNKSFKTIRFAGAAVLFVVAITFVGLRSSGAVGDAIAIPVVAIAFILAAAFTVWGGFGMIKQRKD